MIDLGQLFENHSNCYADTGPEGDAITAMTRDRFVEVVTKHLLLPQASIQLAANLNPGDQFQHINRENDDNIHTVHQKTPHTLIFTTGGGHVTFGITLTTYVKLVKTA